MGFEGLRRVRWGNVGRAVGAVALVAAVVAWPRLTPPAPKAPGDGATPLARPRQETRGEGSPREGAGWRERRRPEKARGEKARGENARGEKAAGEKALREHRGGETAPEAKAEAETAPRAETAPEAETTPRAETAPVASPTVAPRATPDPAQTEFGFEGG